MRYPDRSCIWKMNETLFYWKSTPGHLTVIPLSFPLVEGPLKLLRQLFVFLLISPHSLIKVSKLIKLKKCEKKDNYLDLAGELKKLWNMKFPIIPIVIGAFGTVTKGLLKRLEDLEVGGRVETIHNTALLRTARILRRVLETWGDLLSLKLQWKTIS